MSKKDIAVLLSLSNNGYLDILVYLCHVVKKTNGNKLRYRFAIFNVWKIQKKNVSYSLAMSFYYYKKQLNYK